RPLGIFLGWLRGSMIRIEIRVGRFLDEWFAKAILATLIGSGSRNLDFGTEAVQRDNFTTCSPS
ncbi:hypothetical protein, partial [Thalassotalea mangrovi]|uniref:hypothetical protein n=1 Tax=Thalassotalea mangrovi TaxID=2572245 RepID=UPI001B8072C6